MQCACTFRTFGNHDYILTNLVFSDKNHLLDLDSGVKSQARILVDSHPIEVIIKGSYAQTLQHSQAGTKSNQCDTGRHFLLCTAPWRGKSDLLVTSSQMSRTHWDNL